MVYVWNVPDFQAENRVLRENLGKKYFLLNEDQGRRLAVRAKILGRKTLKPINE